MRERALRGGRMPQHSIYWRKYTCGVCGLTIWVPAYMTGVACPSHECQLNRTEERVNTPADLPVGEYWLPWSLQART